MTDYSSVPQVKVYRANPKTVELEYYSGLHDVMVVEYNHHSLYIVLAEVADTKHYIMLNISSGKVLPQMWHLHEFEEVPPEEI